MTSENTDLTKKLAPGDLITFGHYEQDNDMNNGAEAIRWRVLAREGQKALLISVDNLDSQPYNKKNISVTWEACTLRTWLNNEFLNAAFTRTQQEAILTTMVKNEDNPKFRTRGGRDTNDKVFLLSIAEAETLFRSNEDRVSKNTAYAKAQRAYTNNSGAGEWWLRSPGYQSYVVSVSADGSVLLLGDNVNDNINAIRPALWLDLTSDIVTSEVESSLTRSNSLASEITSLTQKLAPGDLTSFGHYEQDNDKSNGAEAIRWRVLEREGQKVLLFAEQNLDAQPYNTNSTSVTWEKCTLRTWLNNDFLNTAFTQAQQEAILTTSVKNEENPWHRTDSGRDTSDKVFLLSIEEVETIFLSNKDRVAMNTAYAEAQGGHTRMFTEAGEWWLRSPGRIQHHVAMVSDDGFISPGGGGIYSCLYAVRPALWLDLTSDIVTSEAESSLTQSKSLTSENTDLTKKLAPGDLITFGHYEQDNDMNNGSEAILWQVLARKWKKALLISADNLDSQPYNTKDTYVSWKACTLRTWLNNDFLNAAFTRAQQEAILTTTVKSEDNPNYGTDGGLDSRDKVFLLSIAEAETLLKSNEDRVAKNTAYAKAQGAYTNDSGAGWWWLRSPGRDPKYAAYVYFDGSVDRCGTYVNYFNNAVRPALWLDLTSDIVTSETP